ncbi:hypothetical protein D3C77_541800 [compost metagenome]
MLHVLWRRVPIIIKADFPNSDDFLVAAQFRNPVQILVLHRNGILRMPADGSINEIISLGQLHRRRDRLPIKADINKARNPLLYRASNRFLPILIKLLRIQMRVCIYQHGNIPPS